MIPMNYTVQEQVLIDNLHRLVDDYHALERNEGVVYEEARTKFEQGIALAINVLEIRALRRKQT